MLVSVIEAHETRRYGLFAFDSYVSSDIEPLS